MRRGEAARLALIEQAERLFAERGIEAVSLRDVSAAAGQRNHSAAQYHFGDRQGLVAAVYEHRMQIVNDRRHLLLEAAQQPGDASSAVVALVRAAVVPLVDVVDETGGWYGRFLARTRWDTFAHDVLADLPTTASYRRVVERLDTLLVDLPTAVRRHRLDQMLTLIVGTVAGWEWRRQRGEDRLGRDLLAADLVTTVVGLLTAPATAATEATIPAPRPTTEPEPAGALR